MIARCVHCKAQIRDCTAFEPDGYGHQVVQGWYHTDDGHERCRGRTTMARPQPLVNVRCRSHPRRPDRDCMPCVTAVEVMAFFHNNDRCIPAVCVHPHLRGGS
jgi:hypothetical protein